MDVFEKSEQSEICSKKNICRGIQQKFELKNVTAEVQNQWTGSTGEWKLKRE